MIQKLSKDGRIYIEVPDCSIFFKRKNPLFMWEQHKQYFTEASLVLMMNQVNLDCTTKLYGESIEPSICCFMSKDTSMRHEINQEEKRILKIKKEMIDGSHICATKILVTMSWISLTVAIACSTDPV